MFKAIWLDIKAMLRRPLIFILLLLGLAVGVFSLIVYYVSASSGEWLSRTSVNELKTVEGTAYLCSDAYLRDAIDELSEADLPELNYAAYISYGNEGYDYIGLLFNSSDNKLSSGELVNTEWLGQKAVTLSADIKDETIRPGDSIKISGQNFTVAGVMYPGQYVPSMYDVRRSATGAQFVAGINMDVDEELSSRPAKAMFLPIDTFIEMSSEVDYVHVSFKEELTQEQRAEIEQILPIETVTDMEEYARIVDTNRTGKTVVFSAAVLAGMVNIVALFAFFLKENRKLYITYRRCGASPGRIAAIIIGELTVYTLISFLIGCAGALPFIEYSGLVAQHMPYTVLDMALIFVVLLAVELLICLPQIRAIAYGHKKRVGAKKKNERFGHVGGSRFLRLLSYRYSASNAIKIISISLLSCIVVFVLTFAFAYVYDYNGYDRYLRDNFKYSTAAVTVVNNELDESGWTEEDSGEYVQRLRDVVYSLDDTVGVGEVSGRIFSSTHETGLSYEPDKYVLLRTVNADFCSYSPIALQGGSWQAIIDYDAFDESAPVPCIIPEHMSKRFPLGTEFLLGIGPAENVQEDRSFIVVGIARADALRPGFCVYTDNGGKDISNVLMPYAVSSQNKTSGYSVLQEVFIPEICSDGERVEADFNEIPLMLLYSQDNADEHIERWREQLVGYGGAVSFDSLLMANKILYRQGGGGVYLMHGCIAAALLILGIGGYGIMLFASAKRSYGIYFVCGMPWKKAALLMLTGSAIDILLPGAVGAVAGALMAQSIRPFMFDSVKLAALSGFFALAVVYAVSAVITFIALAGVSPQRIMKEEIQ